MFDNIKWITVLTRATVDKSTVRKYRDINLYSPNVLIIVNRDEPGVFGEIGERLGYFPTVALIDKKILCSLPLTAERNMYNHPGYFQYRKMQQQINPQYSAYSDEKLTPFRPYVDRGSGDMLTPIPTGC